MKQDNDTRKWWNKRPEELSWANNRNEWFWYVSQRWQYTGFTPAALQTWLSLFRFASSARSYSSGYPRSFWKGLDDPKRAKYREFTRAIKELVDGGLITTPKATQYDLTPVQQYALALHKRITELQAGKVDEWLDSIGDENQVEV